MIDLDTIATYYPYVCLAILIFLEITEERRWRRLHQDQQERLQMFEDWWAKSRTEPEETSSINSTAPSITRRSLDSLTGSLPEKLDGANIKNKSKTMIRSLSKTLKKKIENF